MLLVSRLVGSSCTFTNPCHVFTDSLVIGSDWILNTVLYISARSLHRVYIMYLQDIYICNGNATSTPKQRARPARKRNHDNGPPDDDDSCITKFLFMSASSSTGWLQYGRQIMCVSEED